jgi:hypothetical protein
MADQGFSWGAHLLIWLFPLLLVGAAVAAHLFSERSKGDRE